LCTACVDQVLESGEAAPVEVRAHLRQSLLALGFGVGGWCIVLAGFVMMVLGAMAGDASALALIGIGFCVLLIGPLAGVVGVGQAAAAIRARGNHMILATAGLILCGLNVGVVLGLLSLSMMLQHK
jgi:hypothetical protein